MVVWRESTVCAILLAALLGPRAAFSEEHLLPIEPETSSPPQSRTAISGGESQPARSVAVPASAPAAYYLITDYLPAAVYNDDDFTACFRVENTTGKKAELQLAISVYDAGGKVLSKRNVAATVDAHALAALPATVTAGTGSVVRFALMNGNAEEAALAVAWARDDCAWPETRLRNGRLTTADSAVVVPVVRKRLRTPERAYVPLKWAFSGDLEEETSGATRAVFMPADWLPHANRKDVIGLGSFSPGTPPLLQALERILSAVKAQPPARLTLFLPPEDFDMGTDERAYRILLEALLAQLTRGGRCRVTLVPPLRFGTPEKLRQEIWRTVFEAAAIFKCRVRDGGEFLQEKLWRVDPAVEGVYGARPNAAGMKKIEQGLADLLR